MSVPSSLLLLVLATVVLLATAGVAFAAQRQAIRRVQTLEIPQSRPAWYAVLYHKGKVFVGTSSRTGSIHVIDKAVPQKLDNDDGSGAGGSKKRGGKRLVLDPDHIRTLVSNEPFHGAVQSLKDGGRFAYFFGGQQHLVTEVDLESERVVETFTGFHKDTDGPVNEFFSRELQQNSTLAISFTACAMWEGTDASGAGAAEHLVCATFPHKTSKRAAHLVLLSAGSLQFVALQSVEPLAPYGDMVMSLVVHAPHGVVYMLTQHALFKLKLRVQDFGRSGAGAGAFTPDIMASRPIGIKALEGMFSFSRAVLVNDAHLFWTGASERGYRIFRLDVSGERAAASVPLDAAAVEVVVLGQERSILMEMRPSCDFVPPTAEKPGRTCRYLYVTDSGRAKVFRYDLQRHSFFDHDETSGGGGGSSSNAPVFASAELKDRAQLWGMAVDSDGGMIYTGSAIDPTDVTVFQTSGEPFIETPPLQKTGDDNGATDKTADL